MCASTPGSLLVIPQQIPSADSYHPIQLSEFEKQKKDEFPKEKFQERNASVPVNISAFVRHNSVGTLFDF